MTAHIPPDATVHVVSLDIGCERSARAGRRAIIDNDGATVGELVNDHGVSASQIGQLVRSGRLRLEGGTEGAVTNLAPNRDCITCRKPFHSEGIHNRMCDRCRRDTGALI